MRLKRVLWIGIRLLIAFGILYYLFTEVPISRVFSVFFSANLHYVFFATLLTLLMQLISGFRLKLITDNQGMTISLFRAFEINITAAFYRLFLPGGNLTGGAIRIYKLSAQDRKVAEALVAIAFDRVIATIALCVVGIFFWLLHLPTDSGYVLIIMSVILFALMIVSVLFHINRLGFIENKLTVIFGLFDISYYMNRFIETLNRFKTLSSSSINWIILTSITSQLLGIFVYYQLALSLDIDISFVAMGWIRSAVVLITMIPISISGLGIREGSLILLLRTYGIQEDEALAFSILVFAATIVIIGLLGGLWEGKRFLGANV